MFVNLEMFFFEIQIYILYILVDSQVTITKIKSTSNITIDNNFKFSKPYKY